MKICNPIILLKSIVSILLVVGLFSCADEEIASNKVNVEEGIMTDLSLSFTSATPTVQSRGALEIQQEYKVYNLYVFVFNKTTGAKEYGHLFELNATNDADKLLDVYEKTNISDATTSGKVNMKIPSGEKRIYAVANVPSGDSHATLKDNLDAVQSIDDLQNNVVISQKIITRPNDKLVMSGWLQNDTQKEEDPAGYCVIDRNRTNNLSTIKLVRVDARVTFNVTLDDSVEPTAERGEVITERKFTPLKYAVKSVPDKAYLYGKDDNEFVEDVEYFSTNEANFEVIENNVSSFTFYMMENRQAATGLSVYEEREKQKKNSDGSNGDYTHAPSTATYIEVTGYYFEKYKVDGVEKERHADVKYTIHLGYVGGDANDFRCKRNYAYTYNVYVQSVNKIRLEVTSYDNGKGTTDEAQPGAEGAIIESDKYFQFDSHYDHILVTFNKENIKGKYGFRVKTPFDEGYYYVSSESVPGALPLSEAKDYKWVKFMQHEKTRKRVGGNVYKYTYNSDKYTDFKPRKSITVDELLKDLHTTNEPVGSNSVYDSDGNAVYTMYIDEYHYPCDPRDGYYGEYDSNGKLTSRASDKEGTTFWKKFVNQPNREMHILCNTQFSEDKESSLTTSTIMISQRSIKTFYNEKAIELETAWGLETINETGKIEPGSSNPWSTSNSSKNGLWNFFSQTLNFNSYKASWSSYISSKVVPDKNGLHDYMNVKNNNKLIYSCLQRNRDEDGDGVIDEDEVKWYPAAIDQYSSIWIGAPALPTETYLYTNQVATEQGYRRYLSSDGKELYAEEGASIGSFSFGYANSIWSTADAIEKKYDYRCLRNLGMLNGKPADESDMPQHFVTPTNVGGRHFLELTYINDDALRIEDNYMRGEITAHDEKSDLNRPYVKLEFKDELVYNTNNTKWGWNDLNSQINNDPNASPCAKFNVGLSADEPKWRLPNARELSLMTSNYSAWGDETYVQSRTGSSLPVKKTNNNGYSGGYSSSKPFVTLATNDYKGPVRCVRDVNNQK